MTGLNPGSAIKFVQITCKLNYHFGWEGIIFQSSINFHYVSPFIQIPIKTKYLCIELVILTLSNAYWNYCESRHKISQWFRSVKRNSFSMINEQFFLFFSFSRLWTYGSGEITRWWPSLTNILPWSFTTGHVLHSCSTITSKEEKA